MADIGVRILLTLTKEGNMSNVCILVIYKKQPIRGERLWPLHY